jgi:regulator of protease activity HflC (stomatin/prohibitin superfamily)
MGDIISWAAIAIAGVFAVITFFGCFFSVGQAEAAVVETFGKFTRVARSGLNFKAPWITSAHTVDLMTNQLDGKIETKTKDNVFVTLPVTIQYCVIATDEGIRNSYYKLSDPEQQIESYLYNILLGHIPEMDLDEIFVSQPSIALRATKELQAEMTEFGYQIVKVLITDITPDHSVKAAMNQINEQTRLKVANEARGEAEKILVVKQAEADAEAKRLNGQGIAWEREEIAKGWQKSIETVKQGTDLDDKAATFLLLFTNWTDMLKDVGESDNSTMIFIPSGPEGLVNFQQTMTNALLAGKK